jgi:spore germination cell wall hydrolase CwlJ-like protein
MYTRKRTHSRYRIECAHPAASCVGQRNELYCAACTVSGEARGDSEKAQSNVIQSMLARRVHVGYPTNLCEIANQGHGVQYAGRFGDHGYVCPKQVEIARKVLAMNINDMDLTSTNFHARYVHPRWRNVRATKSDDAHLFFADGSDYKWNARQRLADLQQLFGLRPVRYASISTSSTAQ